MKIRNRFLALAALLGASTLALTGCVLPVGSSGNPVETDDGTSESDDGADADGGQNDGDVPADTDLADIDLADTEWTGTVNEGSSTTDVELLLNADGTVDFAYFEGSEGPIDHPGDTWSVDGSTVTISLAYENKDGEYNVDMTGDLNADHLELSEGDLGGLSITLDRA